MEKIETKSPIAGKMSSAQLRKIKKPIIEKRRRERINESLNELKALVLDAMQKDESRYSKMEKADILEMTVHHLKSVHRQQKMMPVSDEQDLTQKYTAGFTECAKEVGQYLGTVECQTPELRLRMMSHLSHRMQRGQVQQPQSPIAISPACVSPTYYAPVSPPLTPVAVPCSTPSSSLPGSPVAKYSPETVLPLTLPSGVLVITPEPKCQISPQVPSSMNNAIPLYVANSANCRGLAPVSPQPRPDDHRCSMPEELRKYNISPSLGDDAPSHMFMNEIYKARDTVIAKNFNNNNIKFPISSCKSQALMTCNSDGMSMSGSMWRPW